MQIGTKRLQIEYTKESMEDDNNEKSFYSLQKKNNKNLGMEMKVENVTRLNASVLVKYNKNFPLIHEKKKL